MPCCNDGRYQSTGVKGGKRWRWSAPSTSRPRRVARWPSHFRRVCEAIRQVTRNAVLIDGLLYYILYSGWPPLTRRNRYKEKDMSAEAKPVIPAEYRDLLESTALAHVATVGPKGEPLNNPVWFGWDGDHILFSQTK